MKKILVYIFGLILGISVIGLNSQVYAQPDVESTTKCVGIKLNTNFPIIGNCIGNGVRLENGTELKYTNTFPIMVSSLIKIITSIILIVCFIAIIIAGIMRAMNKPADGKKIIIRVAWTIGLLGMSGIILKLINPTFFN